MDRVFSSTPQLFSWGRPCSILIHKTLRDISSQQYRLELHCRYSKYVPLRRYFSLLYQVSHSTDETQQGRNGMRLSCIYHAPITLIVVLCPTVLTIHCSNVHFTHLPEDVWFNSTCVAHGHPLSTPRGPVVSLSGFGKSARPMVKGLCGSYKW